MLSYIIIIILYFEVLQSLGNKFKLQDFAKAKDLSEHLPVPCGRRLSAPLRPKRYESAEYAEYPCILKQAHFS